MSDVQVEVKTPAQTRLEADAKQRALDKEVADAQVAEHEKVLATAESYAKITAEALAQANESAIKAIDAAAGADPLALEAAKAKAQAASDSSKFAGDRVIAAIAAVQASPDDPAAQKEVIDANQSAQLAAREETLTRAAIAQVPTFDAEAASAAIQAHVDAQLAKSAKADADTKLLEAKQRLAEAVIKAKALEPVTETSPWYYCLETGHAANVIADSRFFQSDDYACPVCPYCKRQVSAIPAVANGVYPSGILAVAARLA